MRTKVNAPVILSACSLVVSIVVLLWGNNLLGRVGRRVDSLERETGSLRQTTRQMQSARQIEQALAYAAAGNMAGRERALTLFRQVVSDLSPHERLALDRQLLAEAERDFAEQHYEDALRKYCSLFTPKGMPANPAGP